MASSGLRNPLAAKRALDFAIPVRRRRRLPVPPGDALRRGLLAVRRCVLVRSRSCECCGGALLRRTRLLGCRFLAAGFFAGVFFWPQPRRPRSRQARSSPPWRRKSKSSSWIQLLVYQFRGKKRGGRGLIRPPSLTGSLPQSTGRACTTGRCSAACQPQNAPSNRCCGPCSARGTAPRRPASACC